MRFLLKNNSINRLYQISFRSAICISIPFFILITWMVADAYLEYHRFVKVVAKKTPAPSFNRSILHFYLRDGFLRSYHRLTSPEMPENVQLPTVQLSIAPEKLVELNSDLPKSGKAKYHKAYLKYKKKSYTVKARYMGDNYWHWLYPQKSWRIKTKKGKLIEDRRKINIKNPRTMLTFNEALSQDLAKEIGLIAPKVFPVKLIQNNRYMGVYLFWEKIDESTIRGHNRMPGSVYDGDGARPDPVTGISQLWADEKWWAKSASRNAEQKIFREDIITLLKGANSTDLKEFYQFVNTYIEKDRYASFLSLDNVTACMHHDFHHNNKFYFDPITGKFEPISWDIDSWHLTNVNLDAGGNPLLHNWKLIPELDLIRHKRLYSLITDGELTVDRILEKTDAFNRAVRPALEADIYRDAKKYMPYRYLNLPKISCNYFTIKQYDLEVIKFKDEVRARIAMLNNYLSLSVMSYNIFQFKDNLLLKVISSGNVGRKMTGIHFKGATASSINLYRDSNRNQILDKEDLLLGEGRKKNGEIYIPLKEDVLPGYKKVPLTSSYKILFGNYRLSPAPLMYNYFIVPDDGAIGSIEIKSKNIVTGKVEKTPMVTGASVSVMETVSLHPWDLPLKPEIEYKVLGPGLVTVQTDLIFEKNIELTILPGTTLHFAEGVSLFSYGKVIAKGTKKKPILFKAKEKEKPWGVFALQGSGADDSKFKWCSWQDGSIASRNLINYSGMVSMHDVDNLSIKNCRIGRNHIGDDGLHLAYCNNFSVENSIFKNARSDAFDIDISKGKIISSRFVRSGNDSLDFMTSEAVVDRCYFKNSGDKGISAGEKSKLEVDRSVFEHCNIGLEIKDQSIVDFKRNVIRNSPTAINLYKKNWRYSGGGKLIADTVFAIDCSQEIKSDKKSNVSVARVSTNEPDDELLNILWQETIEKAGGISNNDKKDTVIQIEIEYFIDNLLEKGSNEKQNAQLVSYLDAIKDEQLRTKIIKFMVYSNNSFFDKPLYKILSKGKDGATINQEISLYFAEHHKSFIQLFKEDYRQINKKKIYSNQDRAHIRKTIWVLSHILKFKYVNNKLEHSAEAMEIKGYLYKISDDFSDLNINILAEGALARGNDPQSFKVSLKALEHTDPKIRADACWAIGFGKGNQAALHKACYVALAGLQNDHKDAIIQQFLHALGHISKHVNDIDTKQTIVDTIIKNNLLSSPTDMIRRNAAIVLLRSKLHTAVIIDILFNMAKKDTAPTVREWITRLSYLVEDKSRVDLWFHQLNDADSTVRKTSLVNIRQYVDKLRFDQKNIIKKYIEEEHELKLKNFATELLAERLK